MHPGNADRMTEKLTALAPGSSECSQTVTSLLLIPYVSIALRDFSPDVKKNRLYIRRELYNNVVCQLARPYSEVLFTERMTLAPLTTWFKRVHRFVMDWMTSRLGLDVPCLDRWVNVSTGMLQTRC